MARKDIIMISQKELKRLYVIHKVFDEVLTQVEAAEMLLLSTRQIRRLVKRIRLEGDKEIRHRTRGRESNKSFPLELKERVLKLYRQTYKGFGPTLTTEKLKERDGIKISDETLRQWLLEAGEWKKGRKSRIHHQWRQRKEHWGEMLQLDGSPHDWFEGRGPRCVLMGYIDDATGRVSGRFYEYEGTMPAMDSFKRYIQKNGLPLSLYLDKHKTYKFTGRPTIEEEIEGKEPVSEFGRALTHSPKAKGRMERLFKTLQDRLVKEMRLRGIKTIEEANEFLDYYLPLYNERFALKAQKEANLHRTIPQGLNLDRILCIKTERTVRNDYTITFNKKLYQIEEVIKGNKVIIEERVDGSMIIAYQERDLNLSSTT